MTIGEPYLFSDGLIGLTVTHFFNLEGVAG